jgi:type IV secretory pathway VirB10-like protein
MEEAGKPNLGQAHTGTSAGDLVPNNKVKPTPNGSSESGTVNASDIERTKSPQLAQSQSLGKSAQSPKSLGEIGKFEEPNTSPNAQGKWTPPPYGSESTQNQQAEKKAKDALSQPSLVFTAHEQSVPHSGLESQTARPDNLGLAPGYHVAARLESMATTAVHAPIVAVVEYNYERGGEVIIPAGARVVGKITQADPSGIVNIAFSSIEFPDGSSVPIDAVGADMNLRAIKGQVTGRQRGKSMLVRSLSGIGETAAMMVGAPNANSSFSENDLLRMQVANNIGNAGDEQIMQMLTMEHIVVCVSAGTEIYVVFEKSAAASSQGSDKTIQIPHTGIGLSQSANAEQP